MRTRRTRSRRTRSPTKRWLAGPRTRVRKGTRRIVRRRADKLVPSAFGLTFAVDAGCSELTVAASWGAYARHTSDEKLDRDGKPARVWRRRSCGGEVRIAVGKAGAIGPLVPDEAEPEVLVRGIVRERAGHCHRLAISRQRAGVRRWPVGAPVGCARHTSTSRRRMARRCSCAATSMPIGLAPAVDRIELAGLEMQYRASVELAVGHGVWVRRHGNRGGARLRHPLADRGHACRGGPADRSARAR